MNPPKLAPSILAADFSSLGREVAAVERAGAHFIHFDVMDGHFVPNLSFGVPVLESIRPLTGLPFDVHLMITDPTRYLDVFARAGADVLNVHWEAVNDMAACLRAIRGLGKKAAFTVKPETPVADILPWAEQADMVLIMSVEPGFGGQAFMPDMLRKAEELADFARGHGLALDIEMDGGLTLGNVRRALDAGVNVIVAGSSLFARGETEARARAFIQAMGIVPRGEQRCTE